MTFNIKKIWLAIIVLVFLIGNLFVIKNIAKKDKIIALCKDNNTNRENFFINRELIRIESENYKLPDDVLLYNLYGDSCFLAEKFCISPLLVFRFSGSNCGSCIDLEFERISQFLKVDSDNVLLIASNKTERDLFLLSEYNSLNYEINYIKNDHFSNIPIEKYNIPYFFYLSEDRRINSIFIPDMDDEYLSKQYYKQCNNFINNIK